MTEKQLAIEAIRKKLVGKELTYKEIYTVMDQISKNKLGDVLIAYFAASGFSKGFSDEEIYHLTKAMVETGEKLKFSGIVADKHSIGGGTRDKNKSYHCSYSCCCGIQNSKELFPCNYNPRGHSR